MGRIQIITPLQAIMSSASHPLKRTKLVTVKQRRTRVACTRCRHLKLKCSQVVSTTEKSACKKCRSLGTDCVVLPVASTTSTNLQIKGINTGSGQARAERPALDRRPSQSPVTSSQPLFAIHPMELSHWIHPQLNHSGDKSDLEWMNPPKPIPSSSLHDSESGIRLCPIMETTVSLEAGTLVQNYSPVCNEETDVAGQWYPDPFAIPSDGPTPESWDSQEMQTNWSRNIFLHAHETGGLGDFDTSAQIPVSGLPPLDSPATPSHPMSLVNNPLNIAPSTERYVSYNPWDGPSFAYAPDTSAQSQFAVWPEDSTQPGWDYQEVNEWDFWKPELSAALLHLAPHSLPFDNPQCLDLEEPSLYELSTMVERESCGACPTSGFGETLQGALGGP